MATQTNTPGYTLSKWADYYHSEPSKRDKIRNVISLEVSDTPLAKQISPPRIVRELDWVEKYWPANKKGKGHSYPKVQLYCLMSVAKSWTVRVSSCVIHDRVFKTKHRTGTSILRVLPYITISSVVLKYFILSNRPPQILPHTSVGPVQSCKQRHGWAIWSTKFIR